MAKAQHTLSYQSFPALLRALREEAGLTQRDLAQRMGRAQAWVHKTEVGDRRADITEFLDWCVGCRIEPEKAFRQLLRVRLGRTR